MTRLVIGPQIWVHWTFQFPTLVKVMNFSLVLWEMITLSLEQKPGCRCRFEGSLSSFSLKGPPLTPPQQQQVHLQKLCSAKGAQCALHKTSRQGTPFIVEVTGDSNVLRTSTQPKNHRFRCGCVAMWFALVVPSRQRTPLNLEVTDSQMCFTQHLPGRELHSALR